MCRADVDSNATEATSVLLLDIAQTLADEASVDVSSVRIGPVDLGSPDDHRPTA
jgi:hypothetical protein